VVSVAGALVPEFALCRNGVASSSKSARVIEDRSDKGRLSKTGMVNWMEVDESVVLGALIQPVMV
jgi:hypothetical protein